MSLAGVLILILAGTSAVGQAAQAAPTDGPQRFEQEQTHMGTRFRIVLYTESEIAATKGFAAGFGKIAQLDACLSDYKDDSELNRLSRSAGGPAQAVSAEMFAVLAESKKFADLSEGAFDVTVGPAVLLWRRAKRQRKLAPAEVISSALTKIGREKLLLDPVSRTVRLTTPGMRLDLGGIAKGYACDEALRVLADQGIRSAMVDGGGGVVVSDAPPGKQGWTVVIQSLGKTATDGSGDRLLLRNQGVATSGDAEQFVEIDGRRYSHIVNPRTGLGLSNRIQATVVAPTGAQSDALATAVCVMGAEKGLALINKLPKVSADVRSLGADGKIVRHLSKVSLPME